MRKAVVIFGLAFISWSGVAFADDYVHGNPYDNYSYPGNTNPYTGQTAPGDPDTYLQHQQQRQHDQSLDVYRGVYGR